MSVDSYRNNTDKFNIEIVINYLFNTDTDTVINYSC